MDHPESLPGGAIEAVSTVGDRFNDLIQRQPGIDHADWLTVLRFLLEIAGDQAMVWEGGQQVKGDLRIEREAKWIAQHRVGLVAVFGDLYLDGDLYLPDPGCGYRPVVMVAGNLTARNLFGGLPLLVLGDVALSGAYLGLGNDGPLRVSGRLAAQAGHVCRNRRVNGPTLQVVEGGVDARSFDLAADDLTDRRLREVFAAEAFAGRQLDEEAMVRLLRQGLSVWRDPSQPLPPEPPSEPTPVPTLVAVDVTTLGTLLDAKAGGAAMVEQIRAKVAFDPERHSYPESLVAFVQSALQRRSSNEQVLHLPPGTVIDGDLLLDGECEWDGRHPMWAILCSGDLTVSGDIVNRNLNAGILLLVAGKLRANNLIKGGATIIVCGDVQAQGIIVAEYNDGVTRIGGTATAQAIIVLDHDFQAVGGTPSPLIHSDETEDLREIFVEAAFDDGEDWPSGALLWASQRAGKDIFRPEFDRAALAGSEP